MPAYPGRPLDASAQIWIESSLRWFLDQFGARQLRADVVVPTARFLPAGYSATTEQIEQLVMSACIRMEVDRQRIDLRLFDGSAEKEAAERSGRKRTVGHFQMERGRAVVSLDLSEAADPVVLLAIIAHELSHVRLLGERRISAQRPDQERLTDLLTVFFGYGVFSTNGAMRFDRRGGFYVVPRGEFDDRTLNAASNAGYHRLGYLKSDEFGYALSCYAWLRKEHNPAWAKFVNAGPLGVMRQGLTFLASASKPGALPTEQMLNQNIKVGNATISVVRTGSAATTFGMTLPGSSLPGTGLPGTGLPGTGLPGTGLPGTGRPGTGPPQRPAGPRESGG
jgi:hypothetical protein